MVSGLQENNIPEVLEHIRTTYRLQYKSRRYIHNFLQSATREDVLDHTKLQRLSTSDILWDEIRSIKKFQAKKKWVYDLTVDGNHTFVANNIIVITLHF